MTLIGYHASHEQFGPEALLQHVQLAEACGFQAAKSSDHFHPWSERQGHSGHAWTTSRLSESSIGSRLQEWAEFDPLYLHLSREPR